MDDILKRVGAYISDTHMLARGAHVVAGVSGGADSMCLLFVLLSLKKALDLKITAVHIHHGLRGAAADGDEAFVKSWCGQHGADCVSFRADIRAKAKLAGISEEECGRLFRYECFEQVRCERGADVIAVAHHKDDLAETVIFNMVRGSNMKGMAGIVPVRGNIIRPLLILRRWEIEKLLEQNGISYRTDATNFEADYTRNKIRLKVLPYLSREINARAVEHIADMAAGALEVSNYVERQAKKAWDRAAQPLTDGHITAAGGAEIEGDTGCAAVGMTHVGLLIDVLAAEDIVIQKALVRMLIERETGKLKDITGKHVQSVLSLMALTPGKQVHLPYGMAAVRCENHIILKKREGKIRREAQKTEAFMDVAVPSSLKISQPGGVLSLTFEKVGQIPVFFKNPCTKCFDYDKINDGLVLRHRCQGDYMTIKGGYQKTVARLMIDDKVPGTLRDRLWLLADGHHVLWIPSADGGRISEHYKIEETTKHVLMIKIKGESDDGRQD